VKQFSNGIFPASLNVRNPFWVKFWRMQGKINPMISLFKSIPNRRTLGWGRGEEEET
jgi:hypothetical protein